MAGERPILIVDDDQALREVLTEQLAFDGEFTATEAATATEAEARLLAGNERYDALILDVGLPDGDGRDLCARLRRQGIKVLLKFLLLEHEQIAHADVVTLMDTVPLIAQTNRRFIGLDPSALAEWASSELVRAGAARRDGDRLLNA